VRENVLVYGGAGLIVVLGAAATLAEFWLGWWDFILDMDRVRREAAWTTGVFFLNTIAAGVLVLLPVQLFGPKDQPTQN
jgi:hypothetical protein